ncbi:MAG: ParB family transcriptional regulator, chromosome partitioning protein [Chloroflexota bacterium]|jgi:ParB family chromosome partitioning protein|nr:ParB family transcriptional regulator, chromosome partitioning protein [Chloroflexota bacterium]
MTADVRRSGGLGRGLAALIPQRDEPAASVELPIAAISHNPYQPRKGVEGANLAELAASIAEHGVLQPILVTPSAEGYQLIAGERRLRAAQMAGLDRIPALVRSADQGAQLAWALIENLQRSDLNALEEAQAFRRLVDEFGLTHEDVGTRVGRSRSAVANTLRLLDLDERVQAALTAGGISEGHARALAGLADAEQQANALSQVVSAGLSVRQTEELVRRSSKGTPKAKRAATARPADVERLERGLREALATKVTLNTSRKGGKITIEYYTQEELERLYERLTGGPA